MAGVIYLLVVFGLLGTLVAFNRSRQRRTPPSKPAILPKPPPSEPRPDSPRINDEFLHKLYVLQARTMELPRPSTPDELLKITSFAELIEVLADPTVEVETLLRYFTGDDGLLAWAALNALARRPHDAAVEERLLARINDFNHWTRHFLLRVLETWHPDDATLVGRVLLRLDESWQATQPGVVLEEFLRRRAALGKLSLGTDRPRGFDAGNLREILARQVEPSLAGTLLGELGELDDAPARRAPGAPPWAAPPTSLGQIGRVVPPGTEADEGLIGCPSADAQLERVIAALDGSPRRSALIVGDPGVGKTSLARRVAARLSQAGWTIFEAGAVQLNAGMGIVGTLEARLQGIRRDLARPRTLWIVPDFHQLLWSGRHMSSPTGILEMLIPSIASGEILVLGEIRPAALERVLAERPEVSRLFEVVRLKPPPELEVAGMLDVWAASAERRSQVAVPGALRAEAMALARQYLSAQTPPGGVLMLLEGALAVAKRRAGPEPATLAMDDLVESLAQLTGLPLDILDERRSIDLEAVQRRFESRVIGQPEAVRCLVDRLALLKAGVTDPNRPTGVFLFAGGSGTGKTELAKTLADYLFGSSARLLRLDMSEFQDASAFEPLLGAGDGFAPAGKSLAERVRSQPFCVVLLDEFEKAHPRIWDVFLQVFDDGRLTDRRGETADFRHAFIILTTNLGTAYSGEARLGLLAGADDFSPTAVERAVRRTFRPELFNRLDRMIVFRPLTREVMRRILRKELADAFARRGLRRRDWAVELEESAIELLVERGFSPTLGARPLRRALEHLLLTPLAAAIVDRRAPEGDQFLFVRADGDSLAVEFVDPDAPEPAALPAMRTVGGPAKAAPAPARTVGGPAKAAQEADGDLASIVFEARGSPVELETLRAALARLDARVTGDTWRASKQALLLETATPGFWDRADRFERLGRAEYLDRIENSLRSAASLLERLYGDARTERATYPRDMVSRLAQQLYLIDSAWHEAMDTGPRDAFVLVEPLHEDAASTGPAVRFASRLVAMYEGWARARGMRLASLGSPAPGAPETGADQVLAIAGFAAYLLLAPEDGLHVWEWDEPGAKATRRATVRVRVEPQPSAPARDGLAGLRQQAAEALGMRGTLSTAVVRRYRGQPSPLVRDAVRGWRTGRIERVLAGDFDVIPARD